MSQSATQNANDSATLGEALFREGRYQEAISHLFEAAYKSSKPAEARMLGQASFRQERPNYDAAIAAFLFALDRPTVTIDGPVAKAIYRELNSVFRAAKYNEERGLCRKK